MTQILSLLQIGSVTTQYAQALCIIRELTCERVTLRTSLALHPDTAVRIGMRGGQVLEGRAIRHDGKHQTIALTQKVHPDLLLKKNRRAASGAESIRLAVSQPVQVVDHERWITRSIDISLQGMRLCDDDALLRAGEEIAVEIDGLGLHRGRVIWTQDGQAGLRFQHSLGFDRLDKWLRSRGGRYAPVFGSPDEMEETVKTG